MDVSRIGAISPTQVDWRKLTSKEIIDFEQQGVEVPSQYLQWAQEFQRTLAASDTDDTTYEMATSEPVSSSTTSKPVTYTSETDNPQTSENTNATNQEELSASAKRKQMEKDGQSLYSIGVEFRSISSEKADESEDAEASSAAASEQSSNSIESLDSYMSELMAEIDALKSDIRSESNKKDNTNIAKINKLNQQVKNLGTSGQTIAASYSLELDNLMSLVEGQSSIPDSGIDYGTETISIGNEMKRIPLIYGAFGRRVVRTGENTVSVSEQAQSVVAQALDTLNSNQDSVMAHQNNIEAQTGISAASVAPENSESNSKDQNGDKKSEADKSVQTAQNDGSEASVIASASIDEILKAKIRKGEDINSQSS